MKTLVSTNPTTGETLWTGAAADAKAVEAVVLRAKAAGQEWASLPIPTRATYLTAFKSELKRERDSLAETISAETGKPLWESKGEVDAMIGKVDLSLEAYQLRCAERTLQLPSGTSTTRHKPHGVVAVFGPFNFPGHLPNGHIVPALLAGNTVIFKPSELTPRVAEHTLEIWQRSQMPTGVLQLVQGGRETGELLARNPHLNGLYFTGSATTGRILLKQFSAHPEKILALEMGGNNPLVIGKAADHWAAAYITVQSAFLTSGQRCSCARRLIVPHTTAGDQFLESLVTLTQTIRVGRYTDTPEPFMGPLINQQAADRVLRAQDSMLEHGAKSLVKAERLPQGPAFLSPGIIDVTTVTDRADEEIFGPLLQLIRVQDLSAAIQEANNTQFGLTAGLLSDDEEEYRHFYAAVHAGVINWNTPLTGASSAMPFGGIGLSGNYRPSAFYAADYCAYPVASLESPRVQIPPARLPGIVLAEKDHGL